MAGGTVAGVIGVGAMVGNGVGDAVADGAGGSVGNAVGGMVVGVRVGIAVGGAGAAVMVVKTAVSITTAASAGTVIAGESVAQATNK